MKTILIMITLLLSACANDCKIQTEPNFLWDELPVTVSLQSFETEEQENIFYEAIELINENLSTDVYEIVGGGAQVKVDFVDDLGENNFGKTNTSNASGEVIVRILSGMNFDYTAEVMTHELIHAIGMGHTENGLMVCFAEGVEKTEYDWRVAFIDVRTWFVINYLQ